MSSSTPPPPTSPNLSNMSAMQLAMIPVGDPEQEAYIEFLVFCKYVDEVLKQMSLDLSKVAAKIHANGLVCGPLTARDMQPKEGGGGGAFVVSTVGASGSSSAPGSRRGSMVTQQTITPGQLEQEKKVIGERLKTVLGELVSHVSTPQKPPQPTDKASQKEDIKHVAEKLKDVIPTPPGKLGQTTQRNVEQTLTKVLESVQLDAQGHVANQEAVVSQATEKLAAIKLSTPALTSRQMRNQKKSRKRKEKRKRIKSKQQQKSATPK